MKPVAIFRFVSHEGPGYLADFLERHGIPRSLIRVDAGEAIPVTLQGYSGLVFMGGPMSVNDDLPWLPDILHLIQEAIGQDMPVLGHCLGGQLMARALGAEVVPNRYKEIGWGAVSVSGNDTARAWFGSVGGFEAFHWHGETFNLPTGVEQVLSGLHCANQAFAVGKHLALQCHVEMTGEMIGTWCAASAHDVAANAASPGVQPVETILAQTPEKLPQLHAVAERLYERWISGLAG